MFIKNKEILEKELSNIKLTCSVLLDNSKNGIDIEIKKHKTKRTNLQNNFYWINCNDIVDLLERKNCFIVKMGIQCKWTRDDVHDVNKTNFGLNTTTKLSTSEFCDYMDNFFAFWIERTKGCWQPRESVRGYAERTGLIQ